MQRDIVIGGKTIRLEVNGDHVTVDGDDLTVDYQLISANEISLIVEGRAYRCLLDRTATDEAIIVAGKRYPFAVEDPRALKSRKARGAGAEGPLQIKSSMPGRVLRVIVSQGEEVVPGQGLLVVEAMKMQNEMKTTRGGRVRRIAVKEGDTVNAGQLLAIID
jgi:biotin carboxyl carrier protein